MRHLPSRARSLRCPALARSRAPLLALIVVGLGLAATASRARGAEEHADPASPRAVVSIGPSAMPGGAALNVRPLGDGVLELRAGTAALAHVPITTPALRRGTPRLREVEVDGHRVAELRIAVRGRAVEEVWIGDLSTRPAPVIWAGLAGARDADEETAVAVEVTPERIFDYQTASQVSRCDGEPVRLFTRAWDFGSARFRPILATVPEPAPASRRLTPRRGDPAMPTARPIGGFHFTSASTTADAGADARALTAPTALDDGDPRTVWAEGLGGDGRGEFLTARASAGHYRVRGLRLLPGDASSATSFKRRNRLRSVSVVFGAAANQRFDLDFDDDPAAAEGKFATPYWIAFPEPVDAACLTVIIRDVYRGSERGPAGSGGTTAISDLDVFTELDDGSGVSRLVADMAAGEDCPSRVPLLVALGERAMLPAAQAVATGAATGVGRECLVEALSRIETTESSAQALTALASALTGASANEERLVADTILRAQTKHPTVVPVTTLGALLTPASRSPAAKRQPAASAGSDSARAARLLARLDRPDAAAALLASAGAADVETRLAIVQALGQSPEIDPGMLIAAIQAVRERGGDEAHRREADLLRALPAVVRRSGAARGLAIETARRSLQASPSFEVRARAILSLGQMAGAGGDITADLVSVRAQSDDAVLRFLATRELGGVSGAASLVALRGALGDRDPRVRETAAQGLGARRDSASEAVLIEAAKSEPWPFARRAQVEALARTCGPAARELLARAMERDVDEVRRVSLLGLVRCRDPRARPTLLATLKNRRASVALRELSGALLGELGERDVAHDLAATLTGLVNEAEGDLAVEGVATSALRSLAQLGGAEAAQAAARLAADVRHPAYRRAAVEALGQICDPDVGAKALGAIRAGSDAALTAAALKAEQRCR